ncbi:hypothetical protein C3F00_035365, partial [Pseudomonas sp. MWU13-2860]
MHRVYRLLSFRLYQPLLPEQPHAPADIGGDVLGGVDGVRLVGRFQCAVQRLQRGAGLVLTVGRLGFAGGGVLVQQRPRIQAFETPSRVLAVTRR